MNGIVQHTTQFLLNKYKLFGGTKDTLIDTDHMLLMKRMSSWLDSKLSTLGVFWLFK